LTSAAGPRAEIAALSVYNHQPGVGEIAMPDISIPYKRAKAAGTALVSSQEPRIGAKLHLTLHRSPGSGKPGARRIMHKRKPVTNRAFTGLVGMPPDSEEPVEQEQPGVSPAGETEIAAETARIEASADAKEIVSVSCDDPALVEEIETEFGTKIVRMNTQHTVNPFGLKSTAHPVVPSTNPNAPFGFDESDRPIGMPVGKPYRPKSFTKIVEAIEIGLKVEPAVLPTPTPAPHLGLLNRAANTPDEIISPDTSPRFFVRHIFMKMWGRRKSGGKEDLNPSLSENLVLQGELLLPPLLPQAFKLPV